MFFKKEGLPKKGELVICTVKKVLPHAAFVRLEEYVNIEAMLHVSEISSRWVKNIKDHVSEGLKVVVKVLDIDEQRGHVDVSLKRVTNSEKTRKLNAEKVSVRMEKLIESIATKLKENPKEALKSIGTKILENFESLSDFYEIVKTEGVTIIDEIELPKKWSDSLKAEISEQLEALRVKLQRNFNLKSFDPEGVELIKDFFVNIEKYAKKNEIDLKMTYVSAPEYTLKITSKNYKECEAQLSDIFKRITAVAKEKNIELEYEEDK